MAVQSSSMATSKSSWLWESPSCLFVVLSLSSGSWPSHVLSSTQNWGTNTPGPADALSSLPHSTGGPYLWRGIPAQGSAQIRFLKTYELWYCGRKR